MKRCSQDASPNGFGERSGRESGRLPALFRGGWWPWNDDTQRVIMAAMRCQIRLSSRMLQPFAACVGVGR